MNTSHKIITIVAFLCFSIKGFTQDIIRNLEDSIQSNIYNKPQKAIELLHEYVKLNEKDNNLEKLILANSALAAAYEVMNELDSTLYYHYKNLSIVKKPIDIIQTKHSIARILDEESRYKESLRLYYQVLELTEENNEKDIASRVKISIESLKNKISKSNDAILLIKKDYERLLNKVDDDDDDSNIRFTRKILIEAYIKNKNFDKALVLIDVGLEDAKDSNDCEFLYYMYFLRSKIRILNNQLKLANTDCEKALECSTKLKNNDFINEIKFRNAEIAYLNKNFKKALDNLIFINNSKVPKSTLQLTKYYKLTADVYKKLKDNERSAEYYILCLKEKEKLSENKLATLETLYNLDLSQEILEKEKYKKIRGVWTGVSIALLLLIIILLAIHKTKSKNNQKRFNDLMQKINAYEEQKTNENKLKQLKINSKTTTEGYNKSDDTTYVIGDKKVQEILRKIQNLENKMFFLRHDCTLHNMAKKLKTNTTYLSKIINTHLGKSFNTYITELRINHAILELKNNKRLRTYSVKGVAEEMGYKNADIFSRYFKEATGLTPAVFIKKIREIQ